MWQTIDSAPKDGSWFLAYGVRLDDDDKPNIGLARWATRKYEQWEHTGPRKQELVEIDDSGWDFETGEIAYPTHWQPLPPPPDA